MYRISNHSRGVLNIAEYQYQVVVVYLKPFDGSASIQVLCNAVHWLGFKWKNGDVVNEIIHPDDRGGINLFCELR